MTLKVTAVLIVLLFAFSCKKDADNNYPVVGKWRFTGTYQSIGGPLTFTPAAAAQANEYVQFKPGGQIQSDYFARCTGYKVTGSNALTIKFKNTAVTQADYIYTIKHDTLALGGRNCIEGCAVLFVKEN